MKNNMKSLISFLIGIAIFATSCQKDPDQYPIEPQIYYQSTTPRTMSFEDTSASIRIELKFTDGDGDIAQDPNDAEISLYMKDSRDTSSKLFNHAFPIPYVPESNRPSKGGLEGGITLNLGKQYFNVTDSLHIALKRDTLQFMIYIQDRAGHKSNLVTTDAIFIQL